VVWGAPRTGPALAAYFAGADYAHNRGGIPLAVFVEHFASWLGWAMQSGVVIAAVVGLIGHAVLGSRAGLGRIAPLLFLAGTVALLCSHAVFHVEITDYIDYLAPALLVCASGSAAWVVQLAQHPRGLVPATLLGATLTLVVWSGSPAIWARTRLFDHSARIMAEGALDEAPQNAIVVVGPDHWAAPMMYLQVIERRRPDVVLVLYGLSSSTWFWELLRLQHPELAEFPLRGAGGREGRIARLLAAEPERAVHASSWSLATAIGERGCDVGYLVALRCAGRPSLEEQLASARLAQALDAVGTGSPPSDGVLADVAEMRGEALWRMGHAQRAAGAFQAGLPRPQRRELRLPRAPGPLMAPPFEWHAQAALGEARRVAFLLAILARMGGAEAEAEHFRAYAAAEGLPEAQVE
jgi:hypothetical protein